MAQLRGPNAYNVGDTSQRDTVAKQSLGSLGYDDLGNVYRYGKAGAVIAINNVVKLNGSALGWDDVRVCTAASNAAGVATAAFASADFGWFLTDGIVSATTAGSIAVGTNMTTGAAGALAAYAGTEASGPVAVVLVNSATPQIVKFHAQ